MKFRSGKNYVHALGLSCCFRQWRASDSHCKYLHGYALQVEIEFVSEQLDDRNWVVGFGELGAIKQFLREKFDHKTVIAEDDPKLQIFRELEKAGVIQLTTVKHVGCEAFAKLVLEFVQAWLQSKNIRATCQRVTIREHEGNWASYGV